MKIICAFDSFKGSLDSPKICDIVKKQLLSVDPSCEVINIPLADGGENTASILAEHFGGGMKMVGNVEGPLPEMRILAAYGSIPSQKTAIVEMAVASGIILCDPDDLEPLKSSTYGTGELLKNAFSNGFKQVYLTLGGSATNDGGAGAAAALGWKFYDKDGKLFKPSGANLLDIHKLEAPANMWAWPKVSVLCDVDNTLTGADGAAAVFGPQKGADADQIKIIDMGLKNLAEIFRRDFGKEIEHLPGTGAAGGFGGGAIGFFNADLIPGTQTILEWLDFEKKAEGAEWILTGEGCLDESSFRGKVLSGVSKIAKGKGAKIAVIAGRVKASGSSLTKAGVHIVEACAPSMIPNSVAMEHAKNLLEEASLRVAERIFGRG
jgi:glycerate 2-kinase